MYIYTYICSYICIYIGYVLRIFFTSAAVIKHLGGRGTEQIYIYTYIKYQKAFKL